MPDALCADDYARVHGYVPDMGDDGTTFAPGTCTTCGRDSIVFTTETPSVWEAGAEKAQRADFERGLIEHEKSLG